MGDLTMLRETPTATKQAILIISDTQRRDMLGCYGGDNVRTLNLDEMAS